MHSLEGLRTLLLPSFENERKSIFLEFDSELMISDDDNSSPYMWKALKNCFSLWFDDSIKQLKDISCNLKEDSEYFFYSYLFQLIRFDY